VNGLSGPQSSHSGRAGRRRRPSSQIASLSVLWRLPVDGDSALRVATRDGPSKGSDAEFFQILSCQSAFTEMIKNPGSGG
jgi:hypothetical protein